MIRNWVQSSREVFKLLETMRVEDEFGFILAQDEAFQRASMFLRPNSKIYLLSDDNSRLLAERLCLQFNQRTDFTTSLINEMTPVINEYDLVIALSFDGRDRNLLSMVNQINCIGATLITISACSPINPLSNKGLLNFYIPGREGSLIENCLGIIVGHFIDTLEVDYQMSQFEFNQIEIPEEHLCAVADPVTILGF